MSPLDDEICSVCLAGAVMAKSLDTYRSEPYDPSDFSSYIQLPLRALEAFRKGHIGLAMELLGYPEQSHTPDRFITDYNSDSSNEFFDDMMDLFSDLFDAGY